MTVAELLLSTSQVSAAPQIVPVTELPQQISSPVGGGVVAVQPFRLLDTRPGASTGDGLGAGAGRIARDGIVEVVTVGRGGVRVDAASVVMNVAAVDPLQAGYLTVWPCGTPRPNASTLNFAAGQTVANLAISAPGTGSKTCIYAAAATHVLVDVSGYYQQGAPFTALVPFRLADTRAGGSTGDGAGGGGGRVTPAAPLEVSVVGRAGVPAGRAVLLNVTVTDPADTGYVTLWPCGTVRPNASNLNFEARQTVANAVFAATGTTGRVCVYSSSPAHVIVDVTGYFNDLTFSGLPPFRLADTRPGATTGDGQGAGTGRIPAGGTLSVVVTGRGGVPSVASGAALNVTVADPSDQGFVTVWRCGTPRPNASNVNYAAHQTIANAVVVGLDISTGATCVFSSAAAHVIVDVSGFESAIFSRSDVAAGLNHSVVLRRDGTVWTFGGNVEGQLGRVTAVASNPIPGEVTQLTGSVAVAAGDNHAIALRSDGTVWTFGDLQFGKLGRPIVSVGNPDAGLVPGSVPGVEGVTAVAAGSEHSVLLKNDGTVWTFGNDTAGQLGSTRSVYNEMPQPVPGLGGVTAVAAGGSHTVVLKADGTVWTFGNNTNGQLGRATIAATVNPTPVQVPGLSGVTAIAAGGSHTVVLKADGTVWSFGNNSTGQLGRATSTPALNVTPQPVAGLGGVAAVAAGGSHTVVLKADGTVLTFGRNSNGQLGNGAVDTNPVTTPTVVPDLTGATAVSAGRETTIMMLGDGSVFTAGSNFSGQLGRTTPTAGPNPTIGPAFLFGTANRLAAGFGHTVVVQSDGTVATFGDNSYGQLGRFTAAGSDSSTPATVPGLGGVTAVAAGLAHTVVLRSDGLVWTFGDNFAGELGRNTADTQSPTPTPVQGLDRVIAIAAGGSFTVALRADGTVWTFGSNSDGQLGRTTASESGNVTPVQVPGLGSVVAIAAGFGHTVALRSDGTVWTFGDNRAGQLGRTTAINSPNPTPAAVLGITQSTAVAAGAQSTVLLTGIRQLLTFGDNAAGQLGRTTPSASPNETPGQVGGLTKVRSVAVGAGHVLALRADGTLWTFGYNEFGQLGRLGGESAPGQVLGVSEVTSVNGGFGHTVLVLRPGTVWTFGSNTNGQLGRTTADPSSNPTPRQLPGLSS